MRTPSENGRVYKQAVLSDRAYCGRHPKATVHRWADVTCPDCLAAGRADGVKFDAPDPR